MVRSRVAALALVVLAMTAGCAGPLFGGDGTERDAYGVPETTVPETTTRTTVETTTTARTTTLTTAASIAFRAAVANHSRSLRTVGQFVLRQRIRRPEPIGNGTVTVNRSVAVDLHADRYWIAPRNASGSGTNGPGNGTNGSVSGAYDAGVAYQDGAAVYLRDELENGTVVYRLDPEAERRPPTPGQWVRRWLRGARNASVRYPFEPDGAVTVAGQRMARFTASDLPPSGCRSGYRTPSDFRNVTTARATAVVDDLGLVRRFECVLAGRLHTGERYRERVTWTLSEVGTATLRPPDRLVGAAENRTGTGDGTATDDDRNTAGEGTATDENR